MSPMSRCAMSSGPRLADSGIEHMVSITGEASYIGQKTD